MFDSVLAHNIPKRQIGRGAILSFVVHALLIALAVYISSRPPSQDKKDARKVMLFNAPPPPPPPPAGGGAVTKPKVEKKKVIKKPDTVIQTTKKDPTPQKPQEREKPAEEPEPGGVEGGVKGGVAGGVVGGVVGGQLGSTIPFGAGMTRPDWKSNPPPTYSREAAAIRVEGIALVKCTITLEGTLTNCRLIKGLPHMDQAILSVLKEWRTKGPVMYQGHPVSVDYTIPVRVVAP